MDIEQSAWEGIDQHRGHDAHPSGHHNGFNTFVLERAHQVVIHLLSACKQAVVSELTLDPQALGSITGSTADPYVADEIMAHLRRGLEQTGLLAEAEGEARPKPDAPTEKKARRASNIVRSITRRRASRDHDQEREAREREAKRNCLSRFASTNMASRAATFGESGRSTPGYASTPGCASASRSDGSPTPMGAAARSPPQQRAGRSSVQFADSVVDELCA